MLTTIELRAISKGRAIPSSRTRKKYLDAISPWLDKKEILVIKGVRRCGKTHIMYQLMQMLPADQIFYFNFDDFYYESHLSTNLLEQIISLRDPQKKMYLFLDEIQRIPGFEKWLRTYYDQELPIKFMIGGSNISLLSPELATVLTGRTITFVIRPLSYVEFKDFSSGSFESYLEFGGFPEVVLEPDIELKKIRLQQYVDDIIAKDVLYRNNIEHPRQIKELATFFLANPGVQISANKIGKQLGIHRDTAQKFIDYLIDAFLIFEVYFFSYSAKERYVHSHASKYYVIDNGFNRVSSFKMQQGALYENCIAISLQSKKLAYWKDHAEIDFIYDNIALQVTSSQDIPARELFAFEEFSLKHKNFKHILITPIQQEKSTGIKEFLLVQVS